MRGQYSNGTTEFDCWRICTAVSKHFTTNYDAIKYHYKMKHLTPSNYGKRRDQYFFRKVTKDLRNDIDITIFAVANAMAGNSWVGNFSHEPYNDLKQTLQSFRYTFTQDLKTLYKIDAVFDNWLLPEDGSAPKIINEMLGDRINKETVIAIDGITGFLDIVNENISDPIIWDDAYTSLVNYRPFVASWVNINKMKNIIIEVFT